jgi:hypothetical protein
VSVDCVSMSRNRLGGRSSLMANLMATNRNPDAGDDLGFDRATLAESELVASVVV